MFDDRSVRNPYNDPSASIVLEYERRPQYGRKYDVNITGATRSGEMENELAAAWIVWVSIDVRIREFRNLEARIKGKAEGARGRRVARR